MSVVPTMRAPGSVDAVGGFRVGAQVAGQTGVEDEGVAEHPGTQLPLFGAVVIKQFGSPTGTAVLLARARPAQPVVRAPSAPSRRPVA